MEHALKGAREVPRIEEYHDFTATDNKYGLPMKIQANEKAISSRFTIPDHMAGWRSEKIVGAHPGAIDAVLTTVMGQGTYFRFKKAAFIKSLSVEYFGLVPVGQELNCVSRDMRQRGDQEVLVEAIIVDGEQNVLAQARGVYQLFEIEQLKAQSSLFGSFAACDPAFLRQFQGLTESIT